MTNAYTNALPNPFLVATPKRVKRTRKAIGKVSRKSNRKAK